MCKKHTLSKFLLFLFVSLFNLPFAYAQEKSVIDVPELQANTAVIRRLAFNKFLPLPIRFMLIAE